MMLIVQAIAGRMDGNWEAIGDEVALAQRFFVELENIAEDFTRLWRGNSRTSALKQEEQ